MSKNHKPFKSDMDYILSELDWIRVRGKRIGLLAAAEERPTSPWRGRVRDTPPKCDCEVKYLLAEEDALRMDIDARLKMNRKDGPNIGLDQICEQHDLGEFERRLLLFGVLPALGSDVLMGCIPNTIPLATGGSVDVEVVWCVLDMPPEERVASIKTLLPTAPLLAAKLIGFGYGPRTTGDIPSAVVELSWPTLATITGVPELAEGEGARSDE